MILGFAGLDLMSDTLGINPRLPPQWRGLSFRVCWRGRSVAIRIEGTSVQATLAAGEAMEIRISGVTQNLTAGTILQYRLAKPIALATALNRAPPLGRNLDTEF